MNPHFLFNTLNNIDSLICSYPEKASKSLVQMSEMMRYMIYETNTPEVDLSQELKYIHNYLDLQQLQYDNPNLVSYTLEGSPDNVRVAPMLFIAFIEMPSNIVRIRKLLRLSACFSGFRNPRYILKYSICSIRQSRSTKIPPAVSG